MRSGPEKSAKAYKVFDKFEAFRQSQSVNLFYLCEIILHEINWIQSHARNSVRLKKGHQ